MDKDYLIRQIAQQHKIILHDRDPVFAELELHGLLYQELHGEIAQGVEKVITRVEETIDNAFAQTRQASESLLEKTVAQADKELLGTLRQEHQQHLDRLQQEQASHESRLSALNTQITQQVEMALALRGEIRAWVLYGALLIGGLGTAGFFAISLKLMGTI